MKHFKQENVFFFKFIFSLEGLFGSLLIIKRKKFFWCLCYQYRKEWIHGLHEWLTSISYRIIIYIRFNPTRNKPAITCFMKSLSICYLFNNDMRIINWMRIVAYWHIVNFGIFFYFLFNKKKLRDIWIWKPCNDDESNLLYM